MMTVRGYTKNLVIVRNIDSDIIEEAYFILKKPKTASDSDIVAEANRLIAGYDAPRAKRKRPPFSVFSFAVGSVVALLAAVIVYLAVL